MRWRGNRRSNNIEDLRGMGGAGGGGGGGLLRLLPLALRVLGVKGTLLVAAGLVAYGLLTGNLDTLLGGSAAPAASAPKAKPFAETPQEQELVDFVAVILADTEDTWAQLFRQRGQTYKEPQLVLFRHSVSSACGLAQAAVGPFYCPTDQKVYIDLSFYQALQERFKAPGDFAQAYVIAHEVGHHVQTLLGISQQVHDARRTLSARDGNRLSVKQELQADCYAGVWAFHANKARQLLEQGDVEEGLNAASAIGDDTLQRQSGAEVSPDSFTHGSAEQRVQWFKAGLSSGNMDSCDTFSVPLGTPPPVPAPVPVTPAAGV